MIFQNECRAHIFCKRNPRKLSLVDEIFLSELVCWGQEWWKFLLESPKRCNQQVYMRVCPCFAGDNLPWEQHDECSAIRWQIPSQTLGLPLFLSKLGLCLDSCDKMFILGYSNPELEERSNPTILNNKNSSNLLSQLVVPVLKCSIKNAPIFWSEIVPKSLFSQCKAPTC